jgi:hypothetical protein
MGHPEGSNALYPGSQEGNMTHSIGRTVFFGAGAICRMGAALALLAAAGCTTASRNQASVADQPIEAGPRDTGTFPNLNVPPQVAADQFTSAQASAKLKALGAERTGQAQMGTGTQVANQAELEQLRKNHAKDALKAIGSKCDPALDPKCK